MFMPPENTIHPWLAHLQGLAAIMKAHNAKNSDSLPSIDFSITLESSFVESARTVNHNTPVDGWFLDHLDGREWRSYGDVVPQATLELNSIANGRFVSASLDHLIQRTHPILQAASRLLQDSHPGTNANVMHLLTAARSQLPGFLAWPSRVPDYWQPKTVYHQVHSSEFSQLDIYPGRIDVYSDRQ
jgi:hypothetical protein